MELAALITWIITALGGAAMLGLWLMRGGQGGVTRFSPGVLFGHFLLAAVGLVIWIIYMVTDSVVLNWVAFVILAVVVALGAVMFTTWRAVRRSPAAPAHASGGGPGGSPGGSRAVGDVAESNFPVPVVYGHGTLGVITLVLVFLHAVGVG